MHVLVLKSIVISPQRKLVRAAEIVFQFRTAMEFVIVVRTTFHPPCPMVGRVDAGRDYWPLHKVFDREPQGTRQEGLLVARSRPPFG